MALLQKDPVTGLGQRDAVTGLPVDADIVNTCCCGCACKAQCFKVVIAGSGIRASVNGTWYLPLILRGDICEYYFYCKLPSGEHIELAIRTKNDAGGWTMIRFYGILYDLSGTPIPITDTGPTDVINYGPFACDATATENNTHVDSASVQISIPDPALDPLACGGMNTCDDECSLCCPDAKCFLAHVVVTNSTFPGNPRYNYTIDIPIHRETIYYKCDFGGFCVVILSRSGPDITAKLYGFSFRITCDEDGSNPRITEAQYVAGLTDESVWDEVVQMWPSDGTPKAISCTDPTVWTLPVSGTAAYAITATLTPKTSCDDIPGCAKTTTPPPPPCPDTCIDCGAFHFCPDAVLAMSYILEPGTCDNCAGVDGCCVNGNPRVCQNCGAVGLGTSVCSCVATIGGTPVTDKATCEGAGGFWCCGTAGSSGASPCNKYYISGEVDLPFAGVSGGFAHFGPVSVTLTDGKVAVFEAEFDCSTGLWWRRIVIDGRCRFGGLHTDVPAVGVGGDVHGYVDGELGGVDTTLGSSCSGSSTDNGVVTMSTCP